MVLRRDLAAVGLSHLAQTNWLVFHRGVPRDTTRRTVSRLQHVLNIQMTDLIRAIGEALRRVART